MFSLYAYGIGAIIILGLIARVIKNFNAPKTLEEQRLLNEARAKANDERREDRAKALAARRAAMEARRREKSDRRNRPR